MTSTDLFGTDLFVFCSRIEKYFSIYKLQKSALGINF